MRAKRNKTKQKRVGLNGFPFTHSHTWRWVKKQTNKQTKTKKKQNKTKQKQTDVKISINCDWRFAHRLWTSVFVYLPFHRVYLITDSRVITGGPSSRARRQELFCCFCFYLSFFTFKRTFSETWQNNWVWMRETWQQNIELSRFYCQNVTIVCFNFDFHFSRHKHYKFKPL